MFKDIEAVIFDMDGVIFDSEKVYYDAFFRAANINNVEASHDFVMGFSGNSTEYCIARLQDYFNGDIKKTRVFFKSWMESRLDILNEKGLGFKKYFLELFNFIKETGKDIALVTSSNYIDMRENFERSNSNLLENFKYIITIEDVKHPKPNPEPYNIAIQYLNIKADKCIVIEDSIPGVTAAISSGANTIMINDNINSKIDILDRLIYKTNCHNDIRKFLKYNGF